MNIINKAQSNQGVSIYKLLSTTSGVGSLIPTKWGVFIMPRTASDWRVVSDAQKEVQAAVASHNLAGIKQRLLDDYGIDIIEDSRFCDYLRATQDLPALQVFVAIPQLALSQANYRKSAEQPLNKHYRSMAPGRTLLSPDSFSIPAANFPRWFYSQDSLKLLPIQEWENMWVQKGCDGKPTKGDSNYFAPPRDPEKATKGTIDMNKRGVDNKVYKPLMQIPMVLICEHGHMTDIPWDKYFSYKLQFPNDTQMTNLLHHKPTPCPSTGKQHELQWMENRSNPESFGSICCSKCRSRISLEGIMNIQPECSGERPWEGVSTEPCKDDVGNTRRMKWQMASSNSVYFAYTCSSLYIPDNLLNGRIDQEVVSAVKTLNDRHNKLNLSMTPQKMLDQYGGPNLLFPMLFPNLSATKYAEVERQFVNPTTSTIPTITDYRKQEYKVFCDNSTLVDPMLNFHRENITGLWIDKYFEFISTVETLAITSTQLGFSRLHMNAQGDMLHICKDPQNQVCVLPASQSMGEGLFLKISKDAIDKWLYDCGDMLDNHYEEMEMSDIDQELVDKMTAGDKRRFYMLHTFSHILMKEFEFACGYPTASLMERLYFSEEMCALLIYTAEGSEGSMGGLVWQGQPTLLEKTIKNALFRAQECSSDPICWEGNSRMNYAACFSCAMVSETACEERNMGLDRRALVDPQFGFFKDIL